MVDTELEQNIRSSNLTQETQINLNSLKGGIPQSHRWAHRNSIISFKDIRPASRYSHILEAYKHENRPLTDREVARMLGFTDLNAVRPRISELIDFGILMETGNTQDKETKKAVRAVKLVPEKQLQFA